jgi:ankyrin repeat protein
MTIKRTILIIFTLFLSSCGGDQEKETKFFAGIEAGDAETVNRFLQDGINPNKKNKNALSGQNRVDTRPIIAAVKADKLEIVKILLAHGADINARNYFQETALHYAAKKGNLNMIIYLIDRGAEINVADTAGNTPLTAVLTYGKTIGDQNNLNIIKLLIEKGADLNVKTASGETPLIIAIKKCFDKPELPQLLIAKGADVNFKNINGDTPLHISASNNNLKLVLLLIDSGADINVKNNNYETPLDVTINRLNAINSKDKHQISEIDAALEPGYKKIADILTKLKNGQEH